MISTIGLYSLWLTLLILMINHQRGIVHAHCRICSCSWSCCQSSLASMVDIWLMIDYCLQRWLLKIGNPQNGWFILKVINIGWFGIPPILRNRMKSLILVIDQCYIQMSTTGGQQSAKEKQEMVYGQWCERWFMVIFAAHVSNNGGWQSTMADKQTYSAQVGQYPSNNKQNPQLNFDQLIPTLALDAHMICCCGGCQHA